MIISQSNNKRKKGFQKWYPFLLGFGLLIFTFFLLKQSNDIGGNTATFSSNMEEVSNGLFIGSGRNFGNGNSQSKEKAFSGKHSSRCTKEIIYGPSLQFKNVQEGDVFIASCWRQSDDGYGVLAFQGSTGFYQQASEVIKRQNGWELIKKEIIIPIGTKTGMLNIYPYNTLKKGAVYFDDIKVIRKKGKKVIQAIAGFKGQHLNFKLDDKDLEKLKVKRLDAFYYGNLVASKKDLVKSKMIIEGKDELSVQIRLKGDLLDHLEGKKWSFRVVPESNKSFLGMTQFSVHNSASRNHLGEWIFHKMLEENEIITTKYDFVKVSLNDDVLGVYAYDQHFDDALMRSYNRKPANIIRISEEGHWLYAPKQLSPRPPWFKSAQIEPFDKQKIKTTQGYNTFVRAQSLLYDFIQGHKIPSEVFDVKRLAKFMAIQDVCIAHHAFNYTNLRFYFNEITGLLEPIGYDGYPGEGTQGKAGDFTGAKINSRAVPQEMYPDKMLQFHGGLFNDYKFSELYLKELEHLSSNNYLDSFISKYQVDINARHLFIKQDYPNYDFKIRDFLKNAYMAQKTINPLLEISIKAYRTQENELVIENYHQFPIEVIGFGNKNITRKISKPTIMESFNSNFPVKRYHMAVGKEKNIFVRTLGTNKVVSFPIFKWESPSLKLEPKQAQSLENIPFLNIGKTQVIVKKGNHILNQELIIVNHQDLIIPAGTKILFKAEGKIITNGKIIAIGTKDMPVLFESVGGQGIIISNAEESIFSNVRFKGLSNIQNGRNFSEGALTVNEASIILTRCIFDDISGKDVVNLVNSTYEISDCVFENASGDGIDADYSKGTITNCIFKKIGKDAIEISGGFCEIDEIEMDHIIGAGIVGNTVSTLEIGSIIIRNATSGIIAKDEGTINIHKLSLFDVKKGLIAYRELGQFKGGRIKITKKDVKNIEKLHTIQNGSELILEGKKIDSN